VSEETREQQYKAHVALRDEKGLTRLGMRANARWHADPRGLGIVLSRYKFVGKMLAGKTRVLEVGCGDGWASRVVQQEIRPGVLVGTELLPEWVDDARQGMEDAWKFDVDQHDMLAGPVPARSMSWSTFRRLTKISSSATSSRRSTRRAC
jgi:SAM-dependent methyltransferase